MRANSSSTSRRGGRSPRMSSTCSASSPRVKPRSSIRRTPRTRVSSAANGRSGWSRCSSSTRKVATSCRRRLARRPHEEGEEVARRAIGPVQVLQHEDDRPLLRQPQQQRQQQREQAALPGALGRGRGGRVGVSAVASSRSPSPVNRRDRDRPARARRRRQLAPFAGAERRRARRRRAGRGAARSRSPHTAARRRPARRTRRPARALPAAVARRSSSPTRRLFDAGVADDEDGAAVGLQRRQLGGATDERSLATRSRIARVLHRPVVLAAGRLRGRRRRAALGPRGARCRGAVLSSSCVRRPGRRKSGRRCCRGRRWSLRAGWGRRVGSRPAGGRGALGAGRGGGVVSGAPRRGRGGGGSVGGGARGGWGGRAGRAPGVGGGGAGWGLGGWVVRRGPGAGASRPAGAVARGVFAGAGWRACRHGAPVSTDPRAQRDRPRSGRRSPGASAAQARAPAASCARLRSKACARACRSTSALADLAPRRRGVEGRAGGGRVADDAGEDLGLHDRVAGGVDHRAAASRRRAAADGRRRRSRGRSSPPAASTPQTPCDSPSSRSTIR